METLVGLVVFTLALAGFVFADLTASRLGQRAGRQTGHWEKVGVRVLAILGMAVGGWLLLL